MTIQTKEKPTRQFYTQNGWEGSRYQYGLSTKEIAAKLREEIKQKYPRKDGYRIGVVYNSFSMGSSIDVIVRGAPFKVFNKEYQDAYLAKDWDKIHKMQDAIRNAAGNDALRNGSLEYTSETVALLEDLKSMARSYRMDDSDGMIDYFHTNFYDHVTVDWQMGKEK